METRSSINNIGWQRTAGLAAVSLALLALTVAAIRMHESPERVGSGGPVPRKIPAATAMRIDADLAMAHGDLIGARKKLANVVAMFESSPSTLEQDEVTVARIRLGYVSAREQDFKEAKDLFVEAASKHRGSEFASPDFGSLVDQAAYQAAVCQAKVQSSSEAVQTFLEFAKSHPRSPLVHTAIARIRRLGDPPNSVIEALDKITSDQQEWVKKQTALCGPKALARVLEIFGASSPSLERLAELCKTTGQGTSMDAMREALHELALIGVGMRVNREDFARLDRGTLWLKDSHFLVIEGVDEDRFSFYDPFSGKTAQAPLPTDLQFTADVLIVRRSPRNPS